MVSSKHQNSDQQLICLICGYQDGDAFRIGDICPSCDAEVCVDDLDLRTARAYRKEWLDNGATWREKSSAPPKDWNPLEQMKNIPPEWL